MGCLVPKGLSYIIWTQQGILFYVYVYTHIHIHKIIIRRKVAMILNDSREGYFGEFGVRKGKKKMKLN